MNEEEIQRLSEMFKALGDPTRIKIIFTLSEGEFCVCHLAERIQRGQSAVSHQLRYLRNLHLVKFRKEGKEVYYSLDDDHVKDIFTRSLEHIKHF